MTEEQEDEQHELINNPHVDPDSVYDDEEHDPHEFDGCALNQ